MTIEQDLTAKDLATLHRMVPRYARVLNTIYDATFAHLERVVDYVTSTYTRHFVANLDQ